MKRLGRYLVVLGGLLLLLVSAAAAEEAVIKVPVENMRTAVSGERLGTLINAVKFTVLDRQPNWYRGELTFFIWKRSVSVTGTTGTVTVAAGENIRSGPPERVRLGSLDRNTRFTVLGQEGDWVRGKIAFWIWGPSVAELLETNKLESIRKYWQAYEYYQRAVRGGMQTLGLAQRAVQQAVALQPVYPQAYFLLGLIERAREDTEAALTAYRTTLAQNPDYAEAHVNMANVYLVDGRYDSAIVHYRQALGRNHELREAYYNLAEVLHALDRDTEAAAVYLEFAQALPQDPTPYYNLACIYALQGRRDASLAWLRRGLDRLDVATLENARQDADLALLHEDPEFVKLLTDGLAAARQREQGAADAARAAGRGR